MAANRATSDADVLAFSCAENRVLLTLNRKHFIRLNGDQPDHTGIIVCSFDHDFFALARGVDEAITAQSEMSRCIIRVNRPQIS